MGTDRRDFLRVACGAGLIFGLGQLGLPLLGSAQDAPDPQQDPSRLALARMKRYRLDGLVIVVPPGEEAQAALGKRLQDLIPLAGPRSKVPEAGHLLLQVVWVCADPQAAQAKPGETLVLLDPSGKRSAGLKLDLDADPKLVLPKLKAFVEGQGRLKARAERAREDAEIAAALASLRDPVTRSKSLSLLRERFTSAAPAIIAQLQAEQDVQLKGRLEGLITSVYWEQLKQAKSFPYGVSWNLKVYEPEPCPPCGMAAPTISGRTFLRFFTR